jgi:ligand-binding SRPBCC domain-containing protein
MQLKIKTKVHQDYILVKEGFTEELFIKLNPPFPPVKLKRFDGCKKGDVVSLELDFILFKQQWESLIVEAKLTEKEFYFIDEGRKLPFFLKYWRHKHRIIKNGSGSKIVDDITFRSPIRPMDFLLYPVLWVQFWYRKPVYKKFFK